MIKLTGNWAIDADQNCYILGELAMRKEKDKDGNPIEIERLTDKRFFATLRGAIEACMRTEQRRMIGSADWNIDEALHGFKQLHSDFEKLLEVCVKEDLA